MKRADQDEKRIVAGQSNAEYPIQFARENDLRLAMLYRGIKDRAAARIVV